MFYRKKTNRSGSVSVQVLRKEGRKNILIRTVGCSSDPYEIDLLCAQAKEYIDHCRAQLSMGLFRQGPRSWFSATFEQVSDIRLLGPELVLGKLFDQIGFDQVPDTLFRDLVLTRITHPSSKLQTTRYLLDHRGLDYNIQKVYRYLDKLQSTQKDLVERISYRHTLSVLEGVLSVVFYDVTTIYFEAEKEDGLRAAGFSKEGKHKHPQILLGLLVSVGGYPLAYDIFKGNTYEGHTLLPVVDTFRQRFGLERLIIVADAGLLTSKNIEELSSKNYEFILGARIKTEKQWVKDKILERPLGDGQSFVVKKPGSLRLIVNYSDKRAKKDRRNRERGLKRLEKQMASGKLTKSSINNRGYNKYLKLEGNIKVTIDRQKYRRDARWDGLKGYLTNTDMRTEHLLDNYNELWKIEKAFRISKTDLRVRPIYHRLQKRIEAHICISFVAYKVYKELERQLKANRSSITVERAIEIIKTIYGLMLEHPATGERKEMIFAKNRQQKELLDIFKITLGDPNG